MKLDQPIQKIEYGRSDRLLHIMWMLHNQCNQQCSYCHPANYSGSHQWLNYDGVVRFLDKIFTHYDPMGKEYLFSFTGGEPAIWPDFFRLCEYLHERGVHIALTTNATKRPEFFEKCAHMFDVVSISYHPESQRDDIVIRNIVGMSGQCHMGVRVMMPPEPHLWERSIQFIEKLKASPGNHWYSLEPVRILADFGTEAPYLATYADWQEDYFNKNSATFVNTMGHEPNTRLKKSLLRSNVVYADGSREELDATLFVNRDLAHFRGWSCRIGLDQLFIDFKGDVWRAGCQVGGILGHMFDDNLKLPIKPILCSKEFCHCNTDVMTPKTNPQLPALATPSIETAALELGGGHRGVSG